METLRNPLKVNVDLAVQHPSGHQFDPNDLGSLCRHVLSQESASGTWAITIALVSDEALLALHDRFMGIPTVTDVMTFPREPVPGSTSTAGGDIVISLDRAWDQGREHGLDGERETRFLFVHGLLHLLGWNDGAPPEREAMHRRQEELLLGFEDVLSRVR